MHILWSKHVGLILMDFIGSPLLPLLQAPLLLHRVILMIALLTPRLAPQDGELVLGSNQYGKLVGGLVYLFT